MQAIQVVGLFNISYGDVVGLQVLGLFNIFGGKVEGLQVVSLFNKSQGFICFQIFGLFNKVGDVEGGQVSVFFNKVKWVDGFQVVFINVVDMVNGVLVGLFNIVKNGYNCFELLFNDVLFVNVVLKFGVYFFYNIFKVGMCWDMQEQFGIVGVVEEVWVYSWGFGYGIGIIKCFILNLMMNVEVICMYINELEWWIKEVNLFNQFSLILGYNGMD